MMALRPDAEQHSEFQPEISTLAARHLKRSSATVGRFTAKLVRPAFVLFVAVVVFWGLLYLGFALLLHAAHESLQSHPDPAPDYAEAVSRFQRHSKNGGTGT